MLSLLGVLAGCTMITKSSGARSQETGTTQEQTGRGQRGSILLSLVLGREVNL